PAPVLAPPRAPHLPYTTLFRSSGFGRTAAGLINLVLFLAPLMGLTLGAQAISGEREQGTLAYLLAQPVSLVEIFVAKFLGLAIRSEEHTSELQSREKLVCRLLL